MTTYLPSHVGICVRDLDRSLRFFCDGLGFEVEGFELDSDTAPGLDRSLEVPATVKIVSQFIQNDDDEDRAAALRRAGRRRHAVAAVATSSGSRICRFYVDDLDAATEHLVDCGATVSRRRAPASASTSLFLADPDGVRVELMGALRPADPDAMPDVELTDDDERFRRRRRRLARRPRRRRVRGR